MKTTKSVGIFVLAVVVLAFVGGCKSKGPLGKGQASAQQVEAAKSLGIPVELALDLGDKVTMKLVLIPAGKFLMGSPETEPGRLRGDGPQHEVTLTKAFHMGIHEVTQAQYEAVIGTNPSHFKDPNNPVENVSWNDAVAFCKKLSAKSGKKVRLPTDAEWEYACRAGTKTRFSSGDNDADLGDYAWHVYNSDHRTHPVGGKKPNGFGLCDMHGNVWEWCSDWYAESYANAKNRDPVGPDSGSLRVLRGGSWITNPQFFRSAYRAKNYPVYRDVQYGFRVAVVAAGVD